MSVSIFNAKKENRIVNPNIHNYRIANSTERRTTAMNKNQSKISHIPQNLLTSYFNKTSPQKNCPIPTKAVS